MSEQNPEPPNNSPGPGWGAAHPVKAVASLEGSILREEIAELAYAYWIVRGRPDGSSDEDWFRAEQAVLARNRK